jgi:hypothetical protein
MINSVITALSSLLLLLWGCHSSPALRSVPATHQPVPLTRVCSNISVQWKQPKSLLQSWSLDSLPDLTAFAIDLNDSISIGFVRGCFPRRTIDSCANGIDFWGYDRIHDVLSIFPCELCCATNRVSPHYALSHCDRVVAFSGDTMILEFERRERFTTLGNRDQCSIYKGEQNGCVSASALTSLFDDFTDPPTDPASYAYLSNAIALECRRLPAGSLKWESCPNYSPFITITSKKP